MADRRFLYYLTALVYWFVCITCLIAEETPFEFYNNGVRLAVSHSDDQASRALVLKLRVPNKQSIRVFEAESPARIVIDIQGPTIARSRSFDIQNSNAVKSMRLGVWPNKLRIVLEMHDSSINEYSHGLEAGWFKLVLRESSRIETNSLAVEVSAAEPAITIESTETTESIFDALEVEYGLTGWSKFSADTTNNENDLQTELNHLDLRPEVEAYMGDSWKAIFSGRADIFTDFDNESSTAAAMRLQEGYIHYSGSNYSIAVGNQTVTWGKADQISPLDSVNPEDLRDGVVRLRGERKVPVPMLNTEIFGDDFGFQILYLPYFRRSRIDFVDSRWSLFGADIDGLEFDEDLPSRSFDNGEIGGRYTANFESFDFALSYLSSYSDLPQFKGSSNSASLPPLPDSTNRRDLAQLAALSGVPLGVEYLRQNVFGLEFETVYESLGIRGDLAYRDSVRFLTNQLEELNLEQASGTLGVDYSSADFWYLNLQYAYSKILNYDSSILFADEHQHGFYAEVSKELFDNYCKVGVRGSAQFDPDAYFINPYFVSSYWDSVQLELGADLVNGEKQSLLGFYRDNDQVYVITRLFF